MPAKINVTSHISFHTWSRRTKFFQNPDGRETTLATGHQDKNKNTYEANILCNPTFKVFQKHTIFSYKTLATTIAETAPPNCPGPLRVSLKFIELESTFHILLFHSLVSHQHWLVITGR